MTTRSDGIQESYDPRQPAELIGYALGLCDSDERRRIEAAFTQPGELDKITARVHRLLAPLDLDPEPAVPTDLSARILARIDRESGILKFPRAAQLPSAAEVAGGGPLLPLRELVGLAAAILLFIGILVPGYRSARTAAQRTVCANNLRMMGTGYAAYAESNAGQLPFTGAIPAGSASWAPSDRTGIPHISNSQHAFLLVRGRFVSPSAFVCPGRPNDFAADADALDHFDNFPDLRNNSYSLDLVTGPWRQNEFEPDMPRAADMNPLVNDDRRLISTGQAPDNSQSHGRFDGQNVLRADMRVNWFRTPRVGIDNDDIYRVVGVERYTGTEIPSFRSDAFLVP